MSARHSGSSIKKRGLSYTVFIPTSGVGLPIGEVTAFTSKSLIKVGKKPAIAYIIEAYPKDAHFVVAVGHFANQVKDYLGLLYSDRTITYVTVDKYEGPGSSLAYTMLKARSYLQKPFIYHASDTIVKDAIPLPAKNWIAGYKGSGSSNYASLTTLDGLVYAIHDKGAVNPDYLHIGLVGIQDYKAFWEATERLYAENPENQALGDLHSLRYLLEDSLSFSVVPVQEWHDVGSAEGLNKARETISDAFHILDKVGESIFMQDDSVVKFFHDERMVSERVARAAVLKGLVPKIIGTAPNFYRYAYVEGDLYADVANRNNFPHFLEWAQTNLWKPIREVSDEEFKKICYDFYSIKSKKRIEKFLSAHSLKDEKQVINGENVSTMEELFSRIDFDWLCANRQTNFHGDFILDNIIKTPDGYSLLDWRQNFGGLLKAGDAYYDLAKLQHNLTVNHSIVTDGRFSVHAQGGTVVCDIMRKNSLVECAEVLGDFLGRTGYDRQKVNVLTALIWLNMSPLHHHPFDLFLFYFGKLNLQRALDDYSS